MLSGFFCFVFLLTLKVTSNKALKGSGRQIFPAKKRIFLEELSGNF